MRLNTVLKVIGLAATLAMPLALVGCDDDETDPTTDAAANDGSIKLDTNGNTDVAPKTDSAAVTDSATGSDTAKTDTGTADAAGDAANAG